MSSQADSICYTIINVPTDNESINELSLKNDLGKWPVDRRTTLANQLPVLATMTNPNLV